jgi:hypothetical protein
MAVWQWLSHDAADSVFAGYCRLLQDGAKADKRETSF